MQLMNRDDLLKFELEVDKLGINSQTGFKYSQESIAVASWLPLIWNNQ